MPVQVMVGKIEVVPVIAELVLSTRQARRWHRCAEQFQKLLWMLPLVSRELLPERRHRQHVRIGPARNEYSQAPLRKRRVCRRNLVKALHHFSELRIRWASDVM